jgi:acyl-CoA synthetase (NDP forming)
MSTLEAKKPSKAKPKGLASNALVRTVWLVRGWTSYESDDVIAAYESEQDANAAVAKLSELRKLQPQCPATEDSEEVWNRYERKRDRWVKQFPSQELAHCDGFSAMELPLHSANDQAQPAAEKTSAMRQCFAAAWLRRSCSSWVCWFMDVCDSIMVADCPASSISG